MPKKMPIKMPKKTDEPTIEDWEPAEAPGPGHNSEIGGVAGDQLLGYIERIERLEEDKAGIQADIKEVLNEAKAAGFSTKVMRQIISLRKMDPEDRDEHLHLVSTYLQAVGIEW